MLVTVVQHVAALSERRQVGAVVVGGVVVAVSCRQHHLRDTHPGEQVLVTQPLPEPAPLTVHWLIENRLHWRHDVILREDDNRIRTETSPQAMAAMRNAMLHLVKDAPGPLRAIREALAENRLLAIKAAQRGLL